VRIGMTVPFADFRRDDFLEWCRRIDNGPFSTLACAERIAHPNYDLVTTLSAAAAVGDALRETLKTVEDAGADEFVLLPVSGDLDQLDRAIEVVAAYG
jgi:hypothetical protein